MGTSPTTEVHGYHRYAVLGLSITPCVFDYHAGMLSCFSRTFLCTYARRITVS